MKKYREFDFEGVIIKVLAQYNEKSGMYIIDEFPDFEEEPIYTPSGKPLVTAMQDRCEHAFSDTSDSDCGACKYYRPNHPDDLIGVCHCEARRQIPKVIQLQPKFSADG